MSKHRATRAKTPLAWRRRRWSDQWYNYRRPRLIGLVRATQRQIQAFVTKYK